MRELEGQKIDLSTWLRWYALDVGGCIAFQRRPEFMEKDYDVDHHTQLGCCSIVPPGC